MIEETSNKKTKGVADWQQKLLPIMSRTIILLAVFFFVASLAQLIYLHRTIANKPQIDLQQSHAFSALDGSPDLTTAGTLASARLRSLVILETAAMENQYFQANMLLMGRLWTSYIGFVTGMILAIVGATFVLGKLQESESALNAKSGGNEISFKTASPGLLMTVLGTVLMMTTLVTNHTITASHAALYLHDEPAAAEPGKSKTDSIAQPVLRAPHLITDSAMNKN